MCFPPLRRPPRPRKASRLKKSSTRAGSITCRISNGDAELIVTLDVGPRIISYKLKGGKNVFKNFEEQMGKSGEKDLADPRRHATLGRPRGCDAHLLPRQRAGQILRTHSEAFTRRYGGCLHAGAGEGIWHSEDVVGRTCVEGQRRPPLLTRSPTSATSRPTWRRGCRR